MPVQTPARTRAPRASSLLYLPANYLGVRPALGARGHHESGAHVRAHGGRARPPAAGSQGRLPPPPRPPGTGRGASHGPARRRAGRGGARAPAPLKFESHHQQVRNPETPDPPTRNVFS